MILVLTLMIFKWIDVLTLRTNEGKSERKGGRQPHVICAKHNKILEISLNAKALLPKLDLFLCCRS